MDRSVIRTQMPALVVGHLPSNSRKFKFRFYDGQPMESVLGFRVDPKPFQGTVIAITELAIVVKTARTEFAVLDRQLTNTLPDNGAKVTVTPYARHNFDGTRVDQPVEEVQNLENEKGYVVRKFTIGGSTTQLPVPKPKCRELVNLIDQIEQMPAPDGFRRLAHLLVDASARDFTCVDPKDADIIGTPPAIRFSVSTRKFNGEVAILYDRAMDVFAVELHRDSVLVNRKDEVYFDDLGAVLEDLIDDGSWRLIRIETLTRNKSRRQNCIQL